MGDLVFWSWTIQFHYSQKRLFSPFLDKKSFFAMKMANGYDKQLTLFESWDWDRFFQPGFEVSSSSNLRAIILTTPWHSNQGEYLDRLICILMYLCICICFWCWAQCIVNIAQCTLCTAQYRKANLISCVFVFVNYCIQSHARGLAVHKNKGCVFLH